MSFLTAQWASAFRSNDQLTSTALHSEQCSAYIKYLSGLLADAAATPVKAEETARKKRSVWALERMQRRKMFISYEWPHWGEQ